MFYSTDHKLHNFYNELNTIVSAAAHWTWS